MFFLIILKLFISRFCFFDKTYPKKIFSLEVPCFRLLMDLQAVYIKQKKQLSKTSKIRISLMGSLTARIHQLSKTMQDTEKAK